MTDISAELDRETLKIKLPVTAVLEPERFAALVAGIAAEDKEAEERLARFIELGMRGQRKSASLISGALLIDLVMEPDSPVRLVSGPDAEIPTVRSSREQIWSSVENVVAKFDRFMTKVENLEIDKLVDKAAGAAEGIERLLESEELTAVLQGARDLVDTAQPVLADLDKLVADVDSELANTRSDIAEFLQQAEATFANLNGLLAADSPTQADIRAVL